jgi:hypothetical protein
MGETETPARGESRRPTVHPSHLKPPRQRPTLQHRNLLAHAPERLHEKVSADYTDMIDAVTPDEIETRRKA